MAASAVNREWHNWVAQLETKARLPSSRRDPERFACLLDMQPGMLVPARFHESATHAKAEELQWNPHCVICRPGEIPAELDRVEEWESGFALREHSTAWTNANGEWRPFSLGDELLERCFATQRFGVPGAKFTAAGLETLLRAEVLLSRENSAVDERQEAASLKHRRERFRESGYCVIEDLVHPFHLGELRRYYRRLIRRGRVGLGDYQSSRRYVSHNEPVARFFHLQLAQRVGEWVGESVKPSYVYFASYQSGAELKRHTDREQCEFSLTFCLDYAPEPENATPWPLHLDTSHGQVAIHQRLGDALLYRGCDVPHSRDFLPDGHTSTSIFFHYVPEDFPGSLA